MTGFKNKWRLLTALVIMIFLVSSASALKTDEILISSDQNWMIAGGSPASIEVIVDNTSVTIQRVDFEVLPTGSQGKLDPETDTGSPWVTKFSSKKSGVAYLKATVFYIHNGVTYSLSKDFEQNVDHAGFFELLPCDYEIEPTVNKIIPIGIFGVDEFGNPVDSRKEDALGQPAEFFVLMSSPETSEIWDGTEFRSASTVPVSVYVNSSGNATALFRVSEEPGLNLVNIFSSGGNLLKSLTIDGIANAKPAKLIVSVQPDSGNPPYQPADGISTFSITYLLLDEWGNPSGNRTVFIDPEDEPGYYLKTNKSGIIGITYGKKVLIGIYSIEATPVDNASLAKVTDLEFVSTDPTNMLLTASPQVMASNDVNPSLRSALRAKVVDEKGNPVGGEAVTFEIIPGTYPLSQMALPYLEAASAVTDQNGQAIVNFVPGRFETNWNSVNYTKMSSASCAVHANWNTTDRYITLEWKNYPYLSVQTNVTPETVKVNDTVEVEVKLIGDGYALQPDPIDVMLTTDRSGSMLKKYPDRMVSVMDAMRMFAGEMNEGRDRLGLVSFGDKGYVDILKYYYVKWSGNDDIYSDDGQYIIDHYKDNPKNYDDHATIDKVLDYDFSGFDDKVGSLVPYGGTPLRKGLFYSLKELKEKGNEDGVKAVILLTDGEFSWYGCPFAGRWDEDGVPGGAISHTYSYDFGNEMQFDDYTKMPGITDEEQDLRVYANNNDIKVYTIAFEMDVQKAKDVLQELSNSTGGKFYDAPDGDKLKEIYKDIAGDLKEAAGVDTEMELMFQNVEINDVMVPNEGADMVLDYKHIPDKSTLIENLYNNGTYTKECLDQGEWWTANHSLNFDVGTIYLNHTWQTTFTLKVLKPGNINLFNQSSKISFNGGADTLDLPDTWITGVADLNSTGLNFTTIDVSGLHITNAGSITDTIDLEWTLDYSGSKTASQTLSYLRLGDNLWIEFWSMPGVAGPVSGLSQDCKFGITDKQPGEYKIRLDATALDTSDDREELSTTIIVGSSADAFIKL